MNNEACIASLLRKSRARRRKRCHWSHNESASGYSSWKFKMAANPYTGERNIYANAASLSKKKSWRSLYAVKNNSSTLGDGSQGISSKPYLSPKLVRAGVAGRFSKRSPIDPPSRDMSRDTPRQEVEWRKVICCGVLN